MDQERLCSSQDFFSLVPVHVTLTVPVSVLSSIRMLLCVTSRTPRTVMKRRAHLAQPGSPSSPAEPHVLVAAAGGAGSTCAWSPVARAACGSRAASSSISTVWITTHELFSPSPSSSSMCSTGLFALTCRDQLVPCGAASLVPQEVPHPLLRELRGKQQQQEQLESVFPSPFPKQKPAWNWSSWPSTLPGPFTESPWQPI